MSDSQKKIVILGAFVVFYVFLFVALTNPLLMVLGIVAILVILFYILFMTNKIDLFHYVLILISCIVLSPILDFSFMFASLRLDDFWLAFGAVVLFSKIAVHKKNFSFKFPSYAKIFMIFIAWICITIAMSAFSEPNLYSNRDWTEVYKSIKLLIYLLIAANLDLNPLKIKKIVNVCIVTLLMSAVFGVMQYFNFLSVNSWLTPMYIFETKLYGLETQKRVIGTFGNPNIFGGAMIIGIALTFSKILDRFKLKYLLTLILFFLAVTLSLSRTALVISVALVAFMFLASMSKSKNKLKPFIFIVITPLIAIIGLKFAPERFFRRMDGLSDLSQDSSFQARLSFWKDIWHTRTKDNFFLGTGPTSNLSITFDNEWLLLLTYYGLFGIIIFIALFGSIYLRLRKTNEQTNKFLIVASRGLIIAFAMSMMVMDVYNLLQLMPLIILVIGVTLNMTYLNKNNANIPKERAS